MTGPYTHNFDAAVKEFLSKDAIVQIEKVGRDDHAALIAEAVGSLLTDAKRRHKLGENAAAIMAANRGAARRTVEYLEPYLRGERG